jgi:hypothetical protein
MATFSLPNEFSPTTLAKAEEVNDNFTAIVNRINTDDARIDLAVTLSGTQTVTGEKTLNLLKLGADANANDKKITTLASPVDNKDAANKLYVDTEITANKVAFGTFSSRTGTEYGPATTDGFVYLQCQDYNHNGGLSVKNSSGDSYIDLGLFGQSSSYSSGSALWPVKTGTYYKTRGTIDVHKWIPMS